jgi:HD-GYP domain-containing protein (c-di-GMP phosphodiesterase class II)
MGIVANLVPFLESLMGLLHQQIEPMEGQHPRRLRLIVAELGKALGFSPDRLLLLELAATLHDLGKVFLPKDILTKPHSLSESERQLIQQHPVFGEQLVRQSGLPEDLALWVRWHHERYDGKGYPDQRGYSDLPLEAQLLALAEALDTLLSPRPYKPALPFDEALARLRQERGKQFAPELLDVLDQTAEGLRRQLETLGCPDRSS